MTSRTAMCSVLLLLPLACAQETSSTTTTQSAAPLETAAPTAVASAPGRNPPGKRDRRRGLWEGRMGGPVGTLLTAAKSMGLPEEQKAKIDEIGESLHKGEDGTASRDAMREFNSALAAGIKAGKLDKAELDKHSAVLDEAHKARGERQAKALGDLHALLPADKRKELVANVKKSQAERDAKLAERPKPAPEDPARVAERNKRRVDQMTTELGLDADQQKKAAALVAKEKPAKPRRAEDEKKRMDAVLAAFEKDTFDGSKLDLVGPAPDHLSTMVAHVTGMLAIIKPEQRDKLAARYERGPGAGFGRGPMMGRGRGPGGPGMRGMPGAGRPAPGGPAHGPGDGRRH